MMQQHHDIPSTPFSPSNHHQQQFTCSILVSKKQQDGAYLHSYTTYRLVSVLRMYCTYSVVH